MIPLQSVEKGLDATEFSNLYSPELYSAFAVPQITQQMFDANNLMVACDPQRRCRHLP